jgi:signal transduction histidine kinase
VTRRAAGSSATFTTGHSSGSCRSRWQYAGPRRSYRAQSRDVQAKFSRIASGLGAAVDELQELSRGIHPAILSDAGLGPALEALALRSPIPVDLKVRTQARFPEPVEVAAYFVASESLANAAKHSRSTRIDVVLAATDETLLLSVRDDGAGGADPRRGSGLVGLLDRVEAVGGSLDIIQ